MFKSKPPKTLTAIGFININNVFTNKGMMVTGDNYGNVVFTNLENNSSKKINNAYLPEGSPEVTSITTKLINADTARVIIGFANGHLCVFNIWMKDKGRPTNNKYPIKIDLTPKGSKDIPSTTGVTIINNTSIAVGLSNRTIRLFDFKPDFNEFKFPTNPSEQALFKAISPNTVVEPTVSTTAPIKSTAILPIESSPGIVMHYVYVLTTAGDLNLFKFDQMFANPSMGHVESGVTNIAAPGIGSTSLVFTTIDGKIWQTNPILNTPKKEFGTLPGRKPITPSSVMTLHGDILYYATLATDNKTVGFDSVQLPHLSPMQTTPPALLHPAPPSSLISSGNPFYNTLPDGSSSPSATSQNTPPAYGMPGGQPPGVQGQSPGSPGTQYVDLEVVDLVLKE